VESPWKVRGEEILSNLERIGKEYKKRCTYKRYTIGINNKGSLTAKSYAILFDYIAYI
jgi:hypothetical protein